MTYSYQIPDNFERRVGQYLQQQTLSSEVMSALKRCTYEYEELGNAYYAGMKNTPWNSNALDFSFIGPKESVAILAKEKSALFLAISKALQSSESGLLLRQLFLLEDDDPSMPVFRTDEERLNADLERSRSVLVDIIKVGERISLNPLYSAAVTENNINDFLRDSLILMGYSETKDQTRHGLSANGVSSGEVDLLLTKGGHEVGLIEGLKLSSVDTGYIDNHIRKATANYNPLGTAVYLVAYVSTCDFGAFWDRYVNYLKSYSFRIQLKTPLRNDASPCAAIRVASTILSRDGYDYPVFFLAIKLSAGHTTE